MRQFRVHDEAELAGVARELLGQFPGKTIFLLEGEMGAGKTTFVRALCSELGAGGVSSPTFSLVNEYKAADGRIILHADLYRVKNLEEALQFGFEDNILRGHYFLIEWPDIIREFVPDPKIVRIENKGDYRLISF